MKSIIIALLLTAAVSFAERGAFGGDTGQKVLSTSASQVSPVSGSGLQRAVLVRNYDASISVYVGYTAGVTSANGFLLKAGETITINTRGALFAVAASGAPTVGFLTESD